MICPLCNTEYREGYYTCADCSVPLVEKTKPNLPEESQKEEFYEGEFVEVFQTTDQSDILTVKLAFDEEQIPNNFSGDFFLGYRPGLLARFFVPSEFELRALDVLRKLTLNTDAQRDRWTPTGR
ncbi:hypothetical protein KI811_18395 [Geobacter hydrogenophilus]|uniref:DUF2007 domain-containing protein n=1 Tax=Geobacter hydrogenophilus TaxID=40983 RepID=A0A9W6FYM3_9BACT|nr:hypothetical protein [Geobacter hydrogenophilus]MBT0895773.1 hypothetical protein [Geobacter hydrogenophilus]GLI37286.1 hypothetical protein GHYDROH2_07870 [Geobacter hydrogenophilus]